MKVVSVTVERRVKINTGNYENTDFGVTLEASVDEGEAVAAVMDTLTTMANDYLKVAVDDIELGKRKERSKAGRFGLQ